MICLNFVVIREHLYGMCNEISETYEIPLLGSESKALYREYNL